MRAMYIDDSCTMYPVACPVLKNNEPLWQDRYPHFSILDSEALWSVLHAGG